MTPVQSTPDPESPLSDDERKRRDELLARMKENPGGPPLTADEMRLLVKGWKLTGSFDPSLQDRVSLAGGAFEGTLKPLPVQLKSGVTLADWALQKDFKPILIEPQNYGRSSIGTQSSGTASSPIGASGSYTYSGFSGYGGGSSFSGYSRPISSGPSRGVLFVAGAAVLGILAAVVYGVWKLIEWIF